MTDRTSGYATANVTSASEEEMEALRPLMRALDEVVRVVDAECACWRCDGREPDDSVHGQASWTA